MLGLTLIILGIFLLIFGGIILYKHYTKMIPNEEYEWLGFGEHPFRKK